MSIPVHPTEFADMLNEVRSGTPIVKNCVIYRGLQDEDSVVRNVSAILAQRRGIQVVETKE